MGLNLTETSSSKMRKFDSLRVGKHCVYSSFGSQTGLSLFVLFFCVSGKAVWWRNRKDLSTLSHLCQIDNSGKTRLFALGRANGLGSQAPSRCVTELAFFFL